MPPNEIHKILPIQNSNQGNDIYTFPANGRGFGPKRPSEIYLSDKEHDGHEVVALKYAFYILAGDKPTLHDEYPLIDKLRTETERNPEEFKERLRLGLDQMFRHIIRKVHASIAVGRYPYRIGKACIIIPSRWDLDFEAVYASILGKALNWADAYARDRMLFFFEPEGLAHFLLYTQLYLSDIIANCGPNEQRPCLVLDFGGHSLVGLRNTGISQHSVANMLLGRMAAFTTSTESATIPFTPTP